ncbi:MAG TPA: FadR/GntR family transcriptional regulator [Steroidobacteraceae bacterium]|nr:FadR/GntR family transcriptional regulator [Steroidobacteraceae bacterium]
MSTDLHFIASNRCAVLSAMSNHNKIAETLGTEILKGVYSAGSKMPAEANLIRRFKVSRTVIREVMKTLAAKGFVVSRTRVGTLVLDPLHWNFFDADVLSWRVRMGLDDEFMRSLTEIRRALEPAAAAFAAQRRTLADIARLRRHISDMACVGQSRKSFAESDLAFHLAVGAASGNPLIRSVASVIEAALVASFTYSSPVDSLKNQEASVLAHAGIVDAIEAGNAQAAAAAMLEVIDVGAKRISGIRRRQTAKKGLKR